MILFLLLLFALALLLNVSFDIIYDLVGDN